MTEENQQQYPLGGLGARFRIARETQRLSQKDVATRLHLSPQLIQIIESEDLRQAPPSTFMRGYLRSYAKLLNITEEEINQTLIQIGFETASKTTITPKLFPVTDSNQKTDRYVHWITLLILSISLILVAIWWNTHPRTTVATTTTVNTTVPEAPTAQPAATLPAPPATPVISTAPATTSTTPATVTQPPVTTTTAPTEIDTPSPTVETPMPPSPAPTTAPPATTVAPPLPDSMLPPAPGSELTTATPVQPDNGQFPRKRSRRHSQDGHVSGVEMALPEPGL
jgi:cytoskeleton protein RodZ